MYVSHQITTPNEAFNDGMTQTDGYADVYLDPNDVNGTLGDSLYLAIEGAEESNNYTLGTTTGDTSHQRSKQHKCTHFYICAFYSNLPIYGQ